MNGLLTEDFPLRDTGCSTGVDAANDPIHRWYVIKEAFSPRLVSHAIREIGVGSQETVLDPFCGSGTVPLAVSQNGISSVGLEVNPFLRFVSQAKLRRPSIDSLQKGFERAVSGIRENQRSPLEGYSTFCGAGKSVKWLFNRSVLRGFEGAWRASARMGPEVRDVIRMTLIGAAMDSCNAFVDGKCLRYKKNWRSLRYGRQSLLRSFQERVSQVREDLGHEGKQHPGVRVRQGDCRTDFRRLFRRNFKLCITSPPYLNSFDY